MPFVVQVQTNSETKRHNRHPNGFALVVVVVVVVVVVDLDCSNPASSFVALCAASLSSMRLQSANAAVDT